MIVEGLVMGLGREVMAEIGNKYGDNLKKVAFNVITDTIESALVGKRTLNEWAEIVIEVIDNIKDKTIRENDFKYLGGTLKFSLYPKTKSKVIIAYELYFVDSDGNYFKNSAQSDVNKDNFTQEDLNAIEESGEIAYEVEE